METFYSHFSFKSFVLGLHIKDAMLHTTQYIHITQYTCTYHSTGFEEWHITVISPALRYSGGNLCLPLVTLVANQHPRKKKILFDFSARRNSMYIFHCPYATIDSFQITTTLTSTTCFRFKFLQYFVFLDSSVSFYNARNVYTKHMDNNYLSAICYTRESKIGWT